MPDRTRTWIAAAACALTLALPATTLTACGSGGSDGTSADPANAVPAAAKAYIGATVRPSGAEQQTAQAFGKALTGQPNSYSRLLSILQTPGSPPLSFQHDVAPWLGPHAGTFLSSLNVSEKLVSPLAQSLLRGVAPSPYPFGSAGGAQGALVLDTSDAGKANSFLSTQAKRAGAHATSYRGVSYQTTASGLALGLVARFAVIGSESGMHEVIDTTLGAGALAHAVGYTTLLAAAPGGALAHAYVNPAVAPGAAGARAAQEGSAGSLQALAGAQPINVSIVLSDTSASVDVDTLSSGSTAPAGGLLSADPQAVQAFGELPGESWLALGLGHVGANLASDVAGLGSLSSLGGVLGGTSGPVAPSSTTLGLGPLLEAMTAPLKVLGGASAQAKRDYASWMGAAGIFAAGASLFELKAAVSIESKDPALSRAAVSKLAAELRKHGGATTPASIPGTDAAIGVRLSGLPVVLDIAAGTSADGKAKFVLGLGEASVQAALNPSSTMSASATRNAAAATLGEGIQPSLIVDFPTLVSLFEAIGFTELPEVAPVVPYLRAATTLDGGARPPGGQVQRYRLVLGVR
jgi:hypothetical protein